MKHYSANEMQVGGTHYTGPLQHWDFAASRHLGYFEGQVTKYVTRWRKKGGLQDLQKARHFLCKLMELSADLDFAVEAPRSLPGQTSVDEFARSNGLTQQECMVVGLVSEWGDNVEYLTSALRMLDGMIQDAAEGEPTPAYVSQGGPHEAHPAGWLTDEELAAGDLENAADKAGKAIRAHQTEGDAP